MSVTVKKRAMHRDRFSTLPDDVAHRILESLSTQQISLLSVVSKRCAQLCLSTPFLGVDDDDLCSRHKRAHLMNYVDRLLCQRSLRDIPVFRFNWYELIDEHQEYRFLSWIHRASLCDNIRELRFAVAILRDGADLRLPTASILLCPSLEILDLRFPREGGAVTFKIPPAPHLGRRPFSSLKSLTLHSVRIDRCFFDWISQCCKCLSSLTLNSTRGTNDIGITSSSLNYLSICYPHTCINLRVYAENLQVLNLVLLTTDPSKVLEIATPERQIFHRIMLYRTSFGFINMYELRNSVYNIYECDRLSSVMQEFASKLSYLNAYGVSVEHMYERGLLPVNLPNLKRLKLHMKHDTNVDIVTLMASFLKGTPKLQFLQAGFPAAVLPTAREEDSEDMETVQHGASELENSSIPKLKLARIALPLGVQKNKLELINFFINSSDRLRILTCIKVPSDIYSRIKAYERKASKAKVNVVLFHQGKRYNQNQ